MTTKSLVIEGPDLNPSRSPFDKKVYRQILLPNGLRALLVSDTIAMTQSYNAGIMPMDMESDGEEDEEEDEEDEDYDDEASDGSNQEGGLRNAAASMVVGAGSMFDPVETQGLAHFLEHLLFMGSKKYPQENAYDEYISKHGGSDNAWTELEHTAYHFEIPQEHLQGALDMFAQFFTSPLMLESSVERELKSIESEFQLVKNSDSSRIQHLMCHTSAKQHPMAKFSWGNLHSLKDAPEANGVDPMKKLREFYEEHYYAANMRLVVIGAYELDTLQEYVVNSFSDVPCKGSGFSFDQPYISPMKDVGMPFDDSSLGKVFYIVPVGDRHGLSVTWQIPSQVEYWQSKPCEYLGHLIGHEAEGSFLASLKKKSWATACCAGVGSEGHENASSHALFIVSVTLSEEGVSHWQEIVSELYQYVGMLRYHCENGLPPWIFEELQSIQEVSHKYDDEQSPEDLVETLAEIMAPAEALPPERILDGNSLLFEYDPDAIRNLVDNYFTPYNARIDMTSTKFGRAAEYESKEISSDGVVISPSNELFDPKNNIPPQKEPMFGTSYWCQAVFESQLQKWSNLSQPQLPPTDSTLALPPKNQFIPSRFSLKALPATDCDHPLLNSSIKLQITVGKRKQWFPANVTQFDGVKKQILVSYEDEEEKWHKVDQTVEDLTLSVLTSPDFEGSLDNKKIKFRIVALAVEGKGAVRKFGDESDFDVEDGLGFPPIPPVLSESRTPKLVCNTNVLKLWHLQDRIFKRPIAELRLCLYCAEANKTPLHAACADLLVYLVSDAMTETAYLASVCEIGSSLSVNDSGFTLRVHGFDDKLLDLFYIIFEMLLTFRAESGGNLPEGIESRRFELCLESYRRRCVNAAMKAQKLASSTRIRCLGPNSWSSNQKLDSIKDLDIKKFMGTIMAILNKIGIEGLYHGNVDESDAKLAQEKIRRLIESSGGGGGLPRKKYPKQLVFQIPKSSIVQCAAKDPTDPNIAVEIYFQVGKDNTFDRVMADLLMEMMYEPLYDQVRTKDQFGYQVSCDSRWTSGVIGMHLQIVTSSKTADEVEDRVEKFLTEFRLVLKDMPQDEFLEHLYALAKQKLDMFNSLSEETGHYWSEIRNGRYSWQVEREEVLCLKGVTKDQALTCYDNWLTSGNSKRRRLSVQVVASDEIIEGIEDYNDTQVKNFHKNCKNQTFGKIY